MSWKEPCHACACCRRAPCPQIAQPQRRGQSSPRVFPRAGTGHSFEIADLTAEAFDPRFSAADFAAYHKDTAPPTDVIAEQERIDRATDLVLVYPVYWWSLPAILKGWIDRVFSNGWAYEYAPEGKVVKKLRHLRVHLLGVAGTRRRNLRAAWLFRCHENPDRSWDLRLLRRLRCDIGVPVRLGNAGSGFSSRDRAHDRPQSLRWLRTMRSCVSRQRQGRDRA